MVSMKIVLEPIEKYFPAPGDTVFLKDGCDIGVSTVTGIKKGYVSCSGDISGITRRDIWDKKVLAASRDEDGIPTLYAGETVTSLVGGVLL